MSVSAAKAPSCSRTHGTQKSVTRASPAASISTLAGVKPAWTTPRRCAASRAFATCPTIRRHMEGAMERLLDFRPGSRSARHQFQRDRLIELQVPGQPHEGGGPAPVEGLELEQSAQVIPRRVHRISPRGGLLDGGHGRRASTVNPLLSSPLTPAALTTRV